MISVELSGGLGNQMFQYAYARSQSLKNGENFRYFFAGHKGSIKRNYELGIFPLKGKRINSFLPELVIMTCCFLGKNFPGYLYGYWQSEKYFKEFEEEIKIDFQFKKLLSGKNRSTSEDIENSNSVSLHVRRSDYVTNSATNIVHGTCDLDYYEKAIGLINKRVKNPKYFVFSDDMKWVKENLKIKNAIYVDGNSDDKSYLDMQLMSLCKHNIIANSSFSWWGAWLNNNPDKIIIAPKKWFNDPKIDTTDLIPEGWIKV